MGVAPASINFCILGRQEAALEFGKAGTSSDITIYDKKARDAVRTWTVPNGFPEKITPLFQAISMSEHVVLYVDALDRFVGEQIIALDALQKKSGIICHTYEIDESRLDQMIKGTVVDGYLRANAQDLADAVGGMALDAATNAGDTRGSEVVIDHSFDVKGVGTVILGRVASGVIKQYDHLTLYPAGSDVLVKSIQMHDDPVDTASYPARVGLAVKGVKPDEIQRGDILAGCTDTSDVVVTHEVSLAYLPSPFYKGGLSENQGCIVSVGLQARAATITVADCDAATTTDVAAAGASNLSLKFAKPIVCRKDDIAVILKPEASPVRIAGSGRVVDIVK